MKKLIKKIRARLAGMIKVAAPAAAALTLLACAPAAKASGTFYANTLLAGGTLVLTNNTAFTNGVNSTAYVPLLSEQYPVGFGGGTNWWANGWTYYTNQSGVIVTNPLPVFATNANWASDARLLPDANGNVPSVSVFASMYGPDTTSTNTLTIVLGGVVGTNHLTAAQNLFTFAIKGLGTNYSNLSTNLPASFLQGIDGVYISYISLDNKASTNSYLQQLRLTGWGPGPNE